jgi:tetratricopeptide (TPR) repeat protein
MKKFIIIVVFLGLNCAFSAEPAAYTKGVQYYQDKKFLLAIGSLKSALDSGYQSPELYLYLGVAYVANEDFDKALESFKLSFESATNADFQGAVNLNIGYLYYMKKDFPKSIDYYNNVLQLNNKLSQVYWYKGLDYYRLKDKDNTIKEWEQYLLASPNGPQSDNIRKALEILKSKSYDINKDPLFANENNSGSSTNSMNTNSMPKVDTLINIEGVLDQVNPTDKGKATDNSLEDIEK